MGQINSDLVYIENVAHHKLFHACKIKNVITKQKTKFQDMTIFDLELFGRTLTLDGYIQSTENDEYIYHESLVQPAMLLHPNPQTVFIGGGGECATAREVLKHKSVKECTMVDIDGECVEFCKKELPMFNKGVFDDKRFNCIIDDANAYLKKTKAKTFDVMIMDLADPTEGCPCYQLYTFEYYNMCKMLLKDDGILVTQATSTDIYTFKDVFAPIYNTLKKVFKYVAPYQVHVPSFATSWGFVIASDKELDFKNIDKLIEERSINLKHYCEDTHKGMFSFSKAIREGLKNEKKVLKSGNYAYIN